MTKLRWLFAALLAVAAAPAASLAQEAATITGRVTNEAGEPVAAATVSIKTLNVGTQTGADGNYRLVVPAARISAAVGVTPLVATRVGFASKTVNVNLQPGAQITQNIQLGTDVLQLEGIVATGQGTQTTRERLTTAISTVQGEAVQQSQETNVVSALAGKAPGVQVTSSSGDPGAGSYIRIRGAASIVAGTQPLFVVDGTPIDNSTNTIESTTGGTAVANRAADINPNDIANIEILKGAAASAIYGSRGANGVVLITTKGGQAGSTRATLSSSVGFDEVTNLVPLQRQYSRGLSLLAFIPTYATIEELNDDFETDFASFDEARAAFADEEFSSTSSYGARLPSGVPTFDHAGELYDTGLRLENNLTLSGGGDRTTYYLGVGRTDQDGTIRGNQSYDRTSVRLKGSHFFSDDIQVTGNVAYAKSGGDLIQQGSNTSGIQLGALRTPPEFNNCLPADSLQPGQPCYVNPASGLQRSYRRPNPTSVNQSALYDNPFFVANENLNTTDVGRTFGNVGIDYAPSTWLKLNYTLGADYSSDERLTYFPNSSAGNPTGSVITANFINYIIDSNLSATASGALNENLVGSVTVGQNLNQEKFSRNLLQGTNLIPGTNQPDFSVDRVPNEFESTVRTDGYFATGDMTLADQLTLTATGRLDGSSTFGGNGERFFYPSVGASWVFSKLPAFENVGWLDFAKLRASWGRTGRQPPVFSNTSGFTTGVFTDGFVSPNGLQSVFRGQTGVFTQFGLGNDEVRPEEKTEREIGFDVAVLGQRASLGVTYYDNNTDDVLLSVPLAPSTGFGSQLRNAAAFEGDGWEVTLDLVPVQSEKFAWNVGAQYARTQTCVTDLAGAEDVFLNGFTGSTVSLVGPDVAGTRGCNQFGVLFGDDFVRFGRGTIVDGQNIDEAFSNAAEGGLYIAEDGFPLFDDQQRVVGDPSPDWTGSIRNTFTIANNLRISGLLDIKQGGDVWNGTKGALFFFGTHEETLPFQGEGTVMTFGEFALPNGETPAVGGPGAGTAVPLNWATWTLNGIGSGFTGPFSQFVEDGSFVKLRDVSVSYTLEQPWLERLGLNTVDLTVSGRNLKTWTDYTGIDPESNLTAQSTGRGLDYFNNPQTRSFIFTVNLNR